MFMIPLAHSSSNIDNLIGIRQQPTVILGLVGVNVRLATVVAIVIYPNLYAYRLFY